MGRRGELSTMPEIYSGPEYTLCKIALQNTPIHFMGIAYHAELESVFELELMGLYQLTITYGPHALRAMLCIYDPDLTLYFDYQSVMVAIHCTVALLQKLPYIPEEREK
jgi:hypothetical protein